MHNINHHQNIEKASESHHQLIVPHSKLTLANPIQMKTVHNSSEEAELVSNLIWRQQTSMPIIKVARYNIEGNDYGYPKIYRIEIEPLVGGLQKLNKIQLTEALYLIKNCLLGIQGLTYKYNNFDFTQIFFAITSNGECKVWISHNLFHYKPSPTALPSQSVIIMNIIRMIQSYCNNSTHLQLHRLINQITKNSNVNFNYTQMNLRLTQFAQLHRISIPTKLKTEQLRSVTEQKEQKEQKDQRKEQKSGSKCSTPCKVNFRYYSPLPRDCSVKKSASSSKIITSQILNGKQNINWHYHNCDLSRRETPLAKSSNAHIKTQPDRQGSPDQQKTSIQSMLKSSQILKNKLKESKNQVRESFILQCRQNEINELYSKINSGKLLKQKSNISSNTKNTSISTCYTSDKNNGFGQNSQFIEPRQQINKVFNQVYYSNNNSNKGNTNNENIFISPYLSHYDFGGLLPFQHKPTLQSQIVQQGQSFNESDQNINVVPPPVTKFDLSKQTGKQTKFFKSKQEPKGTTYHSQNNSPNKKDQSKGNQNKAHVSTILSNININDSNINIRRQKWGWANKVVRLLSEEDDPDMKQSLYYGEQIKQQPLNIELEKLGKMGRQICSTFIPDTNQYS